MRFDLVDLQLFIAVADERSITRGADRAHLALASASARIKGLEEALGVTLLKRGRRGVELTAAGESLLDHARIVMHNVEAMRGDLAGFASGVRASVHLLANTSGLSEHLPKALAARGDQPLRILFYAHGGLVSEEAGLQIAADQVDWWLTNGVYPIEFVWETGLQNPGLDAFVSGELLRLARGGARIIVSIGGGTLEEYVRMTSALQGRPEVAAIEIHLSGRDEELDRTVLGAHPDRLNEIVGAVARMSLVPVFAKLPGACDDIVGLARTAVRAGATGLTHPVLSNVPRIVLLGDQAQFIAETR